ncbi:hypothetical protein PQX77_013288 [Marasmius sp. AFHP31]|nr:hypothetical protein PQX77_013288 [Marasmius sp. AFHP31]
MGHQIPVCLRMEPPPQEISEVFIDMAMNRSFRGVRTRVPVFLACAVPKLGVNRENLFRGRWAEWHGERAHEFVGFVVELSEIRSVLEHRATSRMRRKVLVLAVGVGVDDLTVLARASASETAER